MICICSKLSPGGAGVALLKEGIKWGGMGVNWGGVFPLFCKGDGDVGGSTPENENKQLI